MTWPLPVVSSMNTCWDSILQTFHVRDMCDLLELSGNDLDEIVWAWHDQFELCGKVLVLREETLLVPINSFVSELGMINLNFVIMFVHYWFLYSEIVCVWARHDQFELCDNVCTLLVPIFWNSLCLS